jgi:hypothetical protein
MTPLSATTALDAYFLEARARLLDLAAILDRIDRGAGSEAVSDPRLQKVYEALSVLNNRTVGRAEAVQKLFSLAYEATWQRPKPH